MADLLYIIGSGRSGSTVVERVLNSSPRVCGVGEIHALWRLPIADLLCSCNTQVPHCNFWSATLEHAGIGSAELQRLAQLEASVVRNKYLVKLGYNLDSMRRDDRLAEFCDLQRRLFAGARAASGADIILDSSKAGPRAWVLAAGLEPVILHTKRGAEDVIASWRRPKFEPSTQTPMKKPPIHEAAADWIKVEQAARSLSKVARLERIDYLQFSATPRDTLSSALDTHFPGLVDSITWRGASTVAAAEAYHSVLGNPDRFSRSDIEIRRQRASDRSKFGAGERALIRTIGKSLETIWR